jgi:lysyl-tRNA synthetase class 2
MAQHLVVRLRTTAGLAAVACAALSGGLLALWLSGLLLSWITLGVLGAEAVVFGALAAGLVLRRSHTAPVTWAAAPAARHHELAAARDLIERYGEDSISPFIVRPDKAYAFAAGGVIAYRVFGRTAVVSADPVGPPGATRIVLASFLETARSRGWAVVVYGASANHLEAYHQLGMRSMCVGEEAVVRPDAFSLEGRRVRKLRQSMHRVRRRGWKIVVCDGAEIDAETESEIDALEASWRAERRSVLGFAMSMGSFEDGVHPADLYVLARSPEGRLAAVMRFISHRGKLSLDTMRRIGDTPNGLNEALVCRALEIARERGIPEVSLNYAGLAHLIRHSRGGGRVRRTAIRLLFAGLRRHFQMERLVRFNEKFSPEWRPRYLVYRSRLALPGAVYRTLQAEGHIPQRRPHAQSLATLPPLRSPARLPSLEAGARGG